MGEKTGGAHALLSNAWAYSKFADVVAGPGRPSFVREQIAAKPGDRVLDIGCGTGTIFPLMPDGVDYVGFDISAKYIEAARRRFGDRAEFHCLDVRDADLEAESFDVVVAMGVLHHLDDAGAESLLKLAAKVLVDSGRMTVLDGVFVDDQPRLQRFVVGLDRGTGIRRPEQYEDLALRWFAEVKQTIRSDLIRIPYTHCILECAAPRRVPAAQT